MLTTLMVVAIALLSATLIALIVGLAACIRRLGAMSRELDAASRAIRENIVPLADEWRRTAAEVGDYARSARAAAEQAKRVGESLERLFEGKTVTDAAGKAVSASRVKLVSVVEGVRQALKTFKSAKKEPKKEESEDDQS